MEEAQLFMKLFSSDNEEDRLVAVQMFDKSMLKHLTVENGRGYVRQLYQMVGRPFPDITSSEFSDLFDKIYCQT